MQGLDAIIKGFEKDNFIFVFDQKDFCHFFVGALPCQKTEKVKIGKVFST